jgi:CRP-like cAMP-binding protein
MDALADVEARLAGVDLFTSLTEPQLQDVAALAQRRKLPPNTLVWSRGERTDALVVVLSGRIKAFLMNDEGREITLHVFGPSEYIGEMSIVDGSDHSASIVTLEAAEVLWLPGEAFRKLMQSEPALMRQLLLAQTARVRRLSDELASHAFMTTCRRVARKLLQCAGEGASADVSHLELAGLIGSTRESVTRALADLEKRGLIKTGKQHIALLDRPGLSALLDEL